MRAPFTGRLVLAGLLIALSLPLGAPLACGQGVSTLWSPFRTIDMVDRPATGLPPHVYEPYRPPMGAGAKAMTGDQIIRDLRIRGFREVEVLWRRGRTYLCEAVGPRGERLQLVVDALSADIIGVQILGVAR